jgi:hypothetical protein
MATKSKKQKRPAVEDGDSLTFHCGTYTFRNAAKLPNDIQIARTVAQTVENINKAVNMRVAKLSPRGGGIAIMAPSGKTYTDNSDQ